jgi:hypothetical protein
LNETAPNGLSVRCSGVTKSLEGSISSSYLDATCSMSHSRTSKPTTVQRLPDAIEPVLHRPRVSLAAAIVLALLRAYKVLISPLFTGCCRFYPSCADYTREAVSSLGAFRGLWLGVRRVVRCHPWGGHGFDPVPAPPSSAAMPSTTFEAGLFAAGPSSHEQ